MSNINILSYQGLMLRKELKCSNCVYSKINNTNFNKKTICSLFVFNNMIKNPDNKIYYADIDFCRDRENLCGPYAKYYAEDLKE